MRAKYDDFREPRLVDVIAEKIPVLVCTEGAMKGKLDMRRLSDILGFTRQSFWNSVAKQNSVSADCARKLIALECSKLTADDLLPYIR